jgi:hypothetical protein
MTNAEIHLRAHWGIKTLKERQRALVKVHTDRVRELRNIADEAELAAHGGQDPELIKLECVSLSPERARLLENPIGGL